MHIIAQLCPIYRIPAREAIRAGADMLVVGRPITKPPTKIGTPVDAAKRIADEIEDALQLGG